MGPFINNKKKLKSKIAFQQRIESKSFAMKYIIYFITHAYILQPYNIKHLQWSRKEKCNNLVSSNKMHSCCFVLSTHVTNGTQIQVKSIKKIISVWTSTFTMYLDIFEFHK